MTRVLLLVVLSTLDAWLTLREGGDVNLEANPLLREWLGTPAFWVYKTAGVGVCGWILARLSPRLLWVGIAAMAGVFVVHAVVVVVWCDWGKL